jgi:hypothetical protein
MAIEGAALQPAKPDPNVVLPPAVRKAAQRAEELSAQAKTAREARPPNADDPVRISNPPASQPNPATGVVVTNFDPRNPTPPDPSRQQQTVQQTVTPLAPVIPQALPGPQDWEHQYNSLKGRHERAEAENKRMAQQINDMQRLFASMPTAPPPPRVPVQEGSGVRFSGPIAGGGGQPQRRITDKELDAYGQEMIDVMGRRAQEIVEPMLSSFQAAVQNELGQIRQQLGGVRGAVALTAQDRMYEELRKSVPDWEEINAMPVWHEWLKRPDPMTGLVRQNILTTSYQNNQSQQVIETFKRFMSENNLVHIENPPNPTLPMLPAPANNGYVTPLTQPQVDLTALAAPGRMREGQSSVQPQKPTYTPADIAQFYHDKTFGRYAGREAEADVIERDILRAQSEGRLIR